MRLNFQVLTYFLAIANEESITAACEVLHVTFEFRKNPGLSTAHSPSMAKDNQVDYYSDLQLLIEKVKIWLTGKIIWHSSTNKPLSSNKFIRN